MTFLPLLLLAFSAVAGSQGVVQTDKWNTIDQMCGQVVHLREIPTKREQSSFEDKYSPVKKAELKLYRGASTEACCEKLPLIQRTTSGRDGLFMFATVAPGDYWIETSFRNRIYKLAVRYLPEKNNLVQCKDLLFVLADSGDFQLERVITVD